MKFLLAAFVMVFFDAGLCYADSRILEPESLEFVTGIVKKVDGDSCDKLVLTVSTNEGDYYIEIRDTIILKQDEVNHWVRWGFSGGKKTVASLRTAINVGTHVRFPRSWDCWCYSRPSRSRGSTVEDLFSEDGFGVLAAKNIKVIRP